MPPIAVRERVNQHKPMVESNCDFIWCIGSVFNPISNISKQRHETLSNLMYRNTDVLLGQSVLPSPLPSFTEHPLVELADILIGRHFQRRAAVGCSPLPGKQNVLPLPFI